MPWYYHQTSGKLYFNAELVATGYSGAGPWKNNPDAEKLQNQGPIPQGSYRIGQSFAHPSKGPITMRLSPIGHNAHGRTGFLIHGDSRQHPGQASEGCIVVGRDVRSRIAASGDTSLTVRR